MQLNSPPFIQRHVGFTESEMKEMLTVIGVDSVESLINQTIPENIRMRKPLSIDSGISEPELLTHLFELGKKNKLFKNYIGMGYYGTVMPSVIQRNVFENPGWYTAYTPYQSEVSQGRIEAMLNYQTMICDITALPIANASLLDEGTAAAEAMTMLHRCRDGSLIDRAANSFFVSNKCHPQTIRVIQGRAEPLNIQVVVSDYRTTPITSDFFGVLLQYPDTEGYIEDFRPLIKMLKDKKIKIAVATDLLSLTLLIPPGELGVDVVIGSNQRFGLPLGLGGPHAGFFATQSQYLRQIPGRIMGVSKDRLGQTGLRMSIQTREQHIRRERATSNICTAQALMAVLSGFYAMYHGPCGLTRIATQIASFASQLSQALQSLGYSLCHSVYFDTLKINCQSDPKQLLKIRAIAEKSKINLRYFPDQYIGISIDETTCLSDLNQLVEIFAQVVNKSVQPIQKSQVKTQLNIPSALVRKSSFLTHPIFNQYHSETKMMRYLKALENKDLALNRAMIPLGSCTMKLNSATSMIPLSWPEFANIHPFAPKQQYTGFLEVIRALERDLAHITGLSATSLQPNSGSQGEYAGLLVIRAYHLARGDSHRNTVLIPSSAHGTNPASAALANMEIVFVNCDEKGNIDFLDLREKASHYQNTLCALMVTYPSTHGVFEESITDICDLIHRLGGQIYLDGANMNAQCGLTSPGKIGADVCHLNLHKTFGTPHGGGGPGVGPICVAAHLKDFLPSYGIAPVASAPWGSALVLLIAYAYIKLLGQDGFPKVTQSAILTANYIRARLQPYFSIVYTGSKGMVAHELLIDLRPYKKTAKIEVEDVAKRLIDYGFHAPTMAFPVPGTLMIEPTESESKSEIDRFCDALICIKSEIEQLIEGGADPVDNVLKNAPHPILEISRDDWAHPYSRETAAYPLADLKLNKYWSPVSRIDNAYGDRKILGIHKN